MSLLDTADGLVLICALETLAEIGGAGVLAMVEKALANPDEEVVKTAIGILSRLGDDWLDAYRDRLLAHPHWDVRSCFIKAMVASRGEKALPYLRAALDAEADELVKGQIMAILDRLQ